MRFEDLTLPENVRVIDKTPVSGDGRIYLELVTVRACMSWMAILSGSSLSPLLILGSGAHDLTLS